MQDIQPITDDTEKEKAWEDLGRPKPFQYAFTVKVDKNGGIVTEFHTSGEELARQATPFDVYHTCKELVSDMDTQILVERISRAVAEQIKPQDAASELKSRLLSALSDRGIETPQA